MPSSILVTTHAGRTHIVLNRPNVLNAIDTAMHFELEEAFNDFAADPGQRICVLWGAGGRAFCAGSDLKQIAEMRAAGRQAELAYPAHGYAGLIERFDLDKPVIAAVDGVAYGGGFEIVLACDLVIATTRSRFALPEPRVGAVALAGGMHRLARQIGMKQAMDMVLTAESVGAEEAFRLGFVNAIAAPEDLEAAVDAKCSTILKGAPGAIAASKQMLMRGLDEPSLAAAIAGQHDYSAYAAWSASDELLEGSRAFAEKRSPRWQTSGGH
jgi:crotonobetainyl-CoA hydratase